MRTLPPATVAMIGLVLVVAVIAVACGPNNQLPLNGPEKLPMPADQTADPESDNDPVPTFVVPEGDDGGDCAAGFLLGDTFYVLSRGAVGPEMVTKQTLARGTLYGGNVEVRSVEAVSADVLLAVSIEGGICDDGDSALSP